MLFTRSRSVLQRYVILAFICLVLLWQYFTSEALSGHTSSRYASSPQRATQWSKLEHIMNHGWTPDQYPASTSSFNWSSVHFHYAANKTIGLPPQGNKPLPPVQFPFGKESNSAAATRIKRLNEVKREFIRSWDAYKRFAWMQDALLPIIGGSKDQFSGWAATLVDSLDTLWIMGMREEFDEAVAAVAEIDFGKSTSGRVNIFETNIRYLGGLLAAYDLSGRGVLLEKAVELGDLIYGGFNTPNGMPVDFIDFDLAKTGEGLSVESRVVSASPGTLSLELAHLSQLTGNPKYYSAVANVMDVFYQGQNKTRLPGVWPMFVSMYNKNVVNGDTFTLGGCADSLYEYLPKMHQLLGGGEAKYEVMSKTFLNTVDRHFLFRPMVPDDRDILMPGNVNVDTQGDIASDPEMEHLACFVGGMFGLAGRLFENPADIDRAIKLTNGCVYAYRSFPTGMMPERLDMAPCKNREHCTWNETYWVEERKKRPEWAEHLPKGFTTAKDPRYILRPEAIESVFYMYRITGRTEFQDAAWDMFTAVSRGTRTEYANAAVLDVTRASSPLPQEDYMESFWLAETLKYFYLVFATPDIIDLDDFVLNTEAHPFRL